MESLECLDCVVCIPLIFLNIHDRIVFRIVFMTFFFFFCPPTFPLDAIYAAALGCNKIFWLNKTFPLIFSLQMLFFFFGIFFFVMIGLVNYY